MLRRTEYIDTVTGEIVGSKEKDIPDTLTNEGLLFWLRKSQTRAFQVPLPPGLSWEDKGRFYELSRYIRNDGSNVLCKKERGRYRALTADDIASVTGMSRRSAYRYIGKLVRVGMLGKMRLQCDDGRWRVAFAVNPIYHLHGSRLSLPLYIMFRQSLDRVLSGLSRRLLAQEMGEQQN